MRAESRVWPFVSQVAKDMSAMFDRHGITKASLMAHSYGTFYVSCLLKLLPERVCNVG
jgi:pimeloyl-ACP methyl ester carboxylesterase